jgi:hypothetical protein
MNAPKTLAQFLATLATGNGQPDECGKPARLIATSASAPIAHQGTAFSSKRDAAEHYRTNRPTFSVTNAYDIHGESTHRTPEAALRAARRREGDGWQVIDSNGKRWTMDGPNAVCID